MREVKHYFPSRVWFYTGRGWASRQATKKDTVRRERLLNPPEKENE